VLPLGLGVNTQYFFSSVIKKSGYFIITNFLLSEKFSAFIFTAYTPLEKLGNEIVCEVFSCGKFLEYTFSPAISKISSLIWLEFCV
jgi:hypothetical protein